MKKVEDMDMTTLIATHGSSTGSRKEVIFEEIVKRLTEESKQQEVLQ